MNRRNPLAPGLLDALHVGVLITDSRGRPVRANTAAQRLLGCQADGSPAPKAVLALAGEAQRTSTECEQELLIGQAAVRVRAIPVDGGALLELYDVSSARRLHQAYRDLLAAVSDTLLARVEPLGVLVEVLSAADDPTDAARVLEDLRADAGALVDLIGPPQTPEAEQTAEPNGAAADADRPTAIAQPPPHRTLEQPTVLLVHPADGLLNALAIGLSQAGLGVIAAREVHEALQIAETVTLNVIVLHRGQGGQTGGDACSKLRTVTDAPIVLLDDGHQQPAGGSAHDVVALQRPLRLAELLGAIQETLAAPTTLPAAAGSGVLAVGDVVLDEGAHSVRVRDQPVEMPIKEFEMLRVLLAHAGQAISRERVIELVWGTDFATGRRNLHTHIKRLRQRVEQDPANPEHIVTIRGFGYRFNLPSREGPQP